MRCNDVEKNRLMLAFFQEKDEICNAFYKQIYLHL